MASNFRIQLEEYLKTIDVDAQKVLDIGGLQYPIKGRVNSFKADVCKIFDIEEEMEGRKADYVGDLSRTLQYHNKLQELDNEWDLIFCLEVMEYVFNPVQAIENIRMFLKPGGKAIISFPFVYPSHPPVGTDFLRYTQDGVEKILRECGFKESKIFVRRAGPGRNLLKQFYDEEGMRYRRDDHQWLDHIGYIVEVTRV